MKLWKVQKFFGDIVYDLRSRGLLPVLILLVVGMVAVPILISRGGGSSSSGSLQSTAAAVKPTPESETAVVSYVPPGLRNYKSRLKGLSARDPFVQPESAAPSAASASALSSTVAAPTGVSGGSSQTGSAAPATGTGTSSGTTVTHRLYIYRAVADVSAGDVSQPLVRHKHIQPFTSLPNQVTPVIIYLGSSLDQKRAYFSISKSANQLTGEGTCVPSPTDCSLLALREGQTADLLYSVDGKTYRVKVNDIELKRTTVSG